MKSNVLIVDYEKRLDAFIRSLLRGKGFSSSSASDAVEMSEKLETGLFDIVLVNSSSSDNCVETVTVINEKLPHLPVVVIGSDEAVLEHSALAVFQFLPHPVKINDVYKAVYMANINTLNSRKLDITKRRLNFRLIAEDGERGINCALIKANEGNMLLEIAGRISDEISAELSRGLIRESYDTVMEVSTAGQEKPNRVSVQLAFLEKRADKSIRDVGVRVRAEEFSLIKELLYPNLS